MSTKFLLASLCLILVSWTSPNFYPQLALGITDNTSASPMQTAPMANTDNSVTDQVRQAFMNDNDLAKDVSNINIATKDGIVTLSGTVQDESLKTAFADKAASIPGVKSVNNQIEVNK